MIWKQNLTTTAAAVTSQGAHLRTYHRSDFLWDAKEFPMSFQSLDTAILSEIKRSNHQMGDAMIPLAQNYLRISRLATASLPGNPQD